MIPKLRNAEVAQREKEDWWYIQDDNKIWWCWDGIRVFVIQEEETFGDQNGYPALTLEEAILELKAEGVLENQNLRIEIGDYPK